jgi:hypothetical protein
VSRPLLALVVGVLDRADLRHALVGAAALAAHGVARSTFDIDLLTTDVRVLDFALWTALAAGSGCVVDVRRGDADDPLAGVVRVSRDGEPDVDVVVGRPAWQTEVVERAVTTDLGDLRVRVVTAADLVLLKLFAGGSQDFWDIEQLLGAGNCGALVATVDSRIVRLPSGAQEEWEALKGRQ